MVGYIGSKIVVAQVDGYNKTEADTEFVQASGDTLNGNLSITGDLTVDTNTLYVDSANNRVGIKTTSPAQALHVNGNGLFQGASPNIVLFETDTTDTNARLRVTGGDLIFETTDDAGDQVSENIRIDSAGRVGIGATSLTRDFTVNRSTDSVGISIKSSDSSEAAIYLGDQTDDDACGLIYRNSSDRLDFRVNANTRAVIDSSGRLGIGTSTPSARLESTAEQTAGIFTSTSTNLHTGDAVLRVRSTGDATVNTKSHRLLDLDYAAQASGVTGEYIRFLTGGTQRAELGLAADEFTISQNGSERLRIDSSGNIGIGSNVPSGKLEVNTATSLAYFTRTAGDAGTTNPAFAIGVPSTTTRLISYGDALQFYVAAVGGTAAEAMRINSSGDVGIGTSSPTNTLEVSNETALSGITISGSAGPALTLNDTTNSAFARVSGNNNGRLILESDPENSFIDSSIEFEVDGSEAMRIDSSGNVGIGTASPNAKTAIRDDSGTALAVLSALGTGAGGVGASIDFRNISSNNTEGNGIASIGWGTGTTPDKGYLSFKTSAGSNALSEAMRINSAGSVGIGTSSPEYTLHAATSGSTYLMSERIGSGRVLIGAALSVNSIISRDTALGNRDLNFIVGTSEAMRIDSSGRVGIGTSSPSYTLDIGGQLRLLTNNIDLETDFILSGNAGIGAENSLRYITNNYHAFNVAATDHKTGTSGGGSEAMRIDSSGNLLVGKTSGDSGITAGFEYRPDVELLYLTRDAGAPLLVRRNSSDGDVLFFRRDSSIVGSVSVSTTSTSYNTSSDHRLKEDVQPMVGASDRVLALKPVNFAWKADGTRVDGFLAHEAQQVVPEAVTGEKDAVDDEGNPEYQGIDQSKLVPVLTAALQEALMEIASLKARLDAANL